MNNHFGDITSQPQPNPEEVHAASKLNETAHDYISRKVSFLGSLYNLFHVKTERSDKEKMEEKRLCCLALEFIPMLCRKSDKENQSFTGSLPCALHDF